MLVGILSTALAMSMSMTAFAGQWQSDANGWWWQNDNGSYPANTWQWIDGNNDGTAESYYFNTQGYCLMNTTTPDGYTVNPAGAWIVDGVVQTQTVENTTQNQVPNVPVVNLLDLKPVASSSYNKFTNKRTVQGDLWSKGFINKKIIAASHIYQMMLDADVSNVKCLTFANADVAEFTVPEGAKITKHLIKDLGLPKGTTIGGMIRNGEGILVTGDTQIRPGDHVVVFCLSMMIKKIEKFFN